ncbi:MAG: hypothetical protein HYR49_11645 [Gammaproteobacteria bacterium]|nr:hypothetical protein [Gammaproteobacteria bacterium]
MTLSPEQMRSLKLMDIDVYVLRNAAAAVVAIAAPSPARVPVTTPEAPPRADPRGPVSESVRAEWEALRREVPACTRCPLHRDRTQTVFGVGDQNAEWMLIGEAPGAEEDRQGEPFVGRAGRLLNSMLAAIGLKREEVFIANILKCLRHNAPVQLGDGSWEHIGRLVRSRYAGSVMSVDANGNVIPKQVTGWYESPIGGRRVYKLTYRGAKNAGSSRSGIHLTGDHTILTPRGFIQVQHLLPGDQIATGQGLSALAFDTVCGTLLGDGTLNKQGSYLAFAHSARQREYAGFKVELLRELQPQMHDVTVAAVSGGEKLYPAVHVRTTAHRALRLLRRDFYSPGKRVPGWMSDRLNARMLAIFFMDDGYTRIRPNRSPLAEIATCGFQKDDLQILIAGLARLGLTAGESRGRLYFDAAMTVRLSETIAPYVPQSMRYKLHPRIEKRVSFDPTLLNHGPRRVFYDEVESEDITNQPRADRSFFCIDVEDTHNFVTSGGVVHNCRPPQNRDPKPEEAAACAPFLQRQIALVRPRIILALGRVAAQNLLQTDTPIGRLRGRRYEYPDPSVPVVVTYHPAYLLRSPKEKRKVWDDLQTALGIFRGQP